MEPQKNNWRFLTQPLWTTIREGWAWVSGPSTPRPSTSPVPAQPAPSMILAPSPDSRRERLKSFVKVYDRVAANSPRWLRGGVGRTVALAQSVLESAWYSSDLYTGANNAYGMRPSSRRLHRGETNSGYARYGSVEESVADYLARQQQYDAYPPAGRFSRRWTLDGYLASLNPAVGSGLHRYAEDPLYNSKIRGIIDSPDFRAAVRSGVPLWAWAAGGMVLVGAGAVVFFRRRKRKGGRK